MRGWTEVQILSPLDPSWVTTRHITWIHTVCCCGPAGCRRSQVTAGEAWRVSAGTLPKRPVGNHRGVLSQNGLWPLFLASERGRAAPLCAADSSHSPSESSLALIPVLLCFVFNDHKYTLQTVTFALFRVQFCGFDKGTRVCDHQHGQASEPSVTQRGFLPRPLQSPHPPGPSLCAARRLAFPTGVQTVTQCGASSAWPLSLSLVTETRP